jgi:hypothetical protein
MKSDMKKMDFGVWRCDSEMLVGRGKEGSFFHHAKG